MTFNPDDTQGNILRGYRHLHHVAYVFARFEDVARARRLLVRLVSAEPREPDEKWLRVMRATPWDKHTVHEALNVSLTAEGVRKLGWSCSFEQYPEFLEGMASRSFEYLHDRGESAVEHWEPSLRLPFDVMYVIYADTQSLRDRRVEELRARLQGAATAIVHVQRAGKLKDGDKDFGPRENFGFRDSFSQPAVEGGSERELNGEGLLRWPPALERWRPVKLGEFLLGHPDEDHQIAGDDSAGSPLYNGTFMVWRKLRQDVTAFERYFEQIEGDTTMLKAKAVGRWPDGTSLELAPWAQPPQREPRGCPSNAFSYARDRAGTRCPRGSHVRRANPRTTLKWGTERTRRHRLIRRGMPYVDPDGSLGLVFVCFNADIGRQFELVQGDWLMDGDAFGLGTDQDPLLGEGDAGQLLTIPAKRGGTSRFLPRGGTRFVYTRGGAYLFMPGIGALRRMAEGPPRPAKPSRMGPTTFALGAATGLLYALRRRLDQRRRVDDRSHS